MKSFSSILAWLLLAAVLAVPSFLFYNWWSKSSRQTSAEVTPGPVTVNVFPSEGASPSASSQPPAAPQSAASQQERSASARQPEPQPAPAAQPAKPAPQAAAAPVQAVPKEEEEQPSAAPSAAPAAPAEQPAVDVSTAVPPRSSYAPKGDRDPTLSPEDYRRLKEAIRQREEAERMRRLAERSRPREPGPETFIKLQGIVGNAAIINGDMVNTGQTVRGVKIVKIGADYIIGEYKGKRFRTVLK